MARTSKKAITIDDLLQESNYLLTVAPYQIPQNWCWISLGKVCELGKGTSINHKSLPYWDAKSLRGMKVPDIIDSGIVVNAGEKVILVDGENSGEVFSIFEQGYMGSTFRTLHFSKVANEKYATFFIDFHRDQLRESKIGSAIPHLNKELFFELPFPLPPLSEQQRIVDQIESLFAKLDEAKEKAQAVIDGYEDRRAAILHNAFAGELTKEWRKENGKSMESWLSQSLKESCSIGSGGTPSRKNPDYYNGDIPWVKTGEIDWNDLYDTEEHISLMATNNSSAKVYSEGAVLVAMYGMGVTRGRAAILKVNAATNQAVCVLQPKEYLINRYLFYYFMCNYWDIREKAVGGNQLNLSGTIISKFTINIPSVDEQYEIIKALDSLFEKEQSIKEAAEQVIDQIDSIKKSILARAFRGELGTNDPNDESAVELLKRVLVEEQSDDTISKPAIKRTTIPKEIDAQLSTGMERDIIKLFIKADNDIVSMDAIMSLSSKKFEILDTLRALEKRGIIQKNDAGDYSLIK